MVLTSNVALAQRPRREQPDMTIDAKTKAEVIDSLVQGLKNRYVFPDVAAKAEKMLRERQASGEYVQVQSAEAFSDLLSKQLSEVAHDGHLHVFYSYEVLPPEPEPTSNSAPDAEPPQPPGPPLSKFNYGFEEARRLPGNVGYLKLNAFFDPVKAGPVAAAAMSFLANTDALIIDLRQNGGGDPDMVALIASYFFSGYQPVHLNDISWRDLDQGKGYSVVQSWTLPYVPGTRYVNKEVYILTSHFTFSAAEEFANDLKVLKRATVVGETTGGGANPGESYRLQDHFAAFIPSGQAINPTTKKNWEGVGVVPDIALPQEEAPRTAHLKALEHLIQKTQNTEESAMLRRALAEAQEEYQGRKEP